MKRRRSQLQTWTGPRRGAVLANCLENPDDAEIHAELVSLPGGDQISCLKLFIAKTHHLSVAGSVKDGFYARYEEHTAAGVWKSTSDTLSLGVVSRLLEEYRDQTTTWRGLVEWRRVGIKAELENATLQKENRASANVLLTAVGLIAGFVDGFRKGGKRRK